MTTRERGADSSLLDEQNLRRASDDLISAVQSLEDLNASVVSSLHEQEPNERDMKQLDKMLDDDEEEQEEVEYGATDDGANALASHDSVGSSAGHRYSSYGSATSDDVDIGPRYRSPNFVRFDHENVDLEQVFEHPLSIADAVSEMREDEKRVEREHELSAQFAQFGSDFSPSNAAMNFSYAVNESEVFTREQLDKRRSMRSCNAANVNWSNGGDDTSVWSAKERTQSIHSTVPINEMGQLSELFPTTTTSGGERDDPYRVIQDSLEASVSSGGTRRTLSTRNSDTAALQRSPPKVTQMTNVDGEQSKENRSMCSSEDISEMRAAFKEESVYAKDIRQQYGVRARSLVQMARQRRLDDSIHTLHEDNENEQTAENLFERLTKNLDADPERTPRASHVSTLRFDRTAPPRANTENGPEETPRASTEPVSRRSSLQRNKAVVSTPHSQEQRTSLNSNRSSGHHVTMPELEDLQISMTSIKKASPLERNMSYSANDVSPVITTPRRQSWRATTRTSTSSSPTRRRLHVSEGGKRTVAYDATDDKNDFDARRFLEQQGFRECEDKQEKKTRKVCVGVGTEQPAAPSTSSNTARVDVATATNQSLVVAASQKSRGFYTNDGAVCFGPPPEGVNPCHRLKVRNLTNEPMKLELQFTGDSLTIQPVPPQRNVAIDRSRTMMQTTRAAIESSYVDRTAKHHQTAHASRNETSLLTSTTTMAAMKGGLLCTNSVQMTPAEAEQYTRKWKPIEDAQVFILAPKFNRKDGKQSNLQIQNYTKREILVSVYSLMPDIIDIAPAQVQKYIGPGRYLKMSIIERTPATSKRCFIAIIIDGEKHLIKVERR